jgi:8-oxo-dGTP pyrophosphatase MutT (NUDIX family)
MKPHLNPEQSYELAHEWQPDADGVLRRSAARVVLFAPDGTTFLIRGHDFGDTNHWWWFTVGGGIARGESPRQGVLRELREETGLVASADRLVGPVLERHAEFHFALETRRQDRALG